MAEGWFKIHRQINRHPLFVGRADRLGAFVWMIGEAAHKPYRKEIKGQIHTLERGQFTHSIVFMAKAWGWHPSAVNRFVTRLKTETMIETATETGQLVITICNYERYQAREELPETATETATETGAKRERKELEEGKKERKDSSEIDTNVSISAAASAPNGTDEDAMLYREGRALLGEKAGPMITKLKKAKGVQGARVVLAQARQKADPKAYVAGAANRTTDQAQKDLEREAALDEVFGPRQSIPMKGKIA